MRNNYSKKTTQDHLKQIKNSIVVMISNQNLVFLSICICGQQLRCNISYLYRQLLSLGITETIVEAQSCPSGTRSDSLSLFVKPHGRLGFNWHNFSLPGWMSTEFTMVEEEKSHLDIPQQWRYAIWTLYEWICWQKFCWWRNLLIGTCVSLLGHSQFIIQENIKA